MLVKKLLALFVAFLCIPAISSYASSDKPTTIIDGISQAMQAAEHQVQSSSLYTDDPVRKAQAIDFLTKTLAFHIYRDFITNDLDNPRLIFNPAYGAPNVDTFYLFSHIDPRGTYRVYGELGSVNQTIFGLYSNQALDGEEGAGSRIKGDAIKLEDDGTFELFLSTKKRGKNWLPLNDKTTSFTIYQIFGDWQSERKGNLFIERLDTNTNISSLPSISHFEQRLTDFQAGVKKNVGVWLRIFEQIFDGPANVFVEPRIIQVASLGSYFAHAHWKVEEDQALIITFDEPAEASYWSFTCYTAWSDKLDPANRQSSLNFTQAVKDKDGKYRIVMAASDPGIANWLDIEGHLEGVVNWRVTTEKPLKAPEVTIVPLADIKQHLPKAKTITAGQRAQTIAIRKRHMQHRLSQ